MPGRTALLVPLFAAMLLLPACAYALEIGVEPEHPKPGDSVMLTVADYGGNTSNTTYVWSVNNAVVAQGVGQTSIALVAGTLGNAQTVQVLAIENGRARESTTFTIRPSSVDLVWEGNTYSRPFFLGRPLPNGQSTVTVLAIPHLGAGKTEVASNNVIYTWKVNGVLLEKQSGYGKSSAVLSAPKFNAAFTVSVQASTMDGGSVAENTTVIEPHIPTTVFYEDAPLLGVRFDKAITGSFPFASDEVSFIGYPLFVNDLGALSYAWSLDGSVFDTDSSYPRMATFKKIGTGAGNHEISFSFKNPEKFLEEGESSFQLNF